MLLARVIIEITCEHFAAVGDADLAAKSRSLIHLLLLPPIMPITYHLPQLQPSFLPLCRTP